MASGFTLFGPEHLTILTSIPAMSAALAWSAKRFPASGKRIRLALGIFLAANELIWYVWRVNNEGIRFPEALPLQLCDLALWLTVVSALTLKPLVYEVAYFAGMGGAAMALVTPALWAPLWSYPTAYFFLAHGFVVITLWSLAWSGMLRPRPGCVWRVFLILNLYGALVGTFNAIFKTNYMFLCEKPSTASLFDFFGPWPIYVLAGELFALTLFWLLWLPLSRQQANPAS